jgi:hypothetical protein
MARRVTWLRDLSYATRLCQQATDRLAAAASAHSILEPSALHRAGRDVHAIANHVGVSWDSWGLAYGRVRVGLDHGNPMLGPPNADPAAPGAVRHAARAAARTEPPRRAW